MLLEVVADAWDVGSHLKAVGQAHAGDLADSGVRLLGSLGSDLGSHAALERRVEEGRAILKGVEATRQSDRLGLALELASLSLDELVDSRH